ncbi:secretoglobin family 3A member 1 isoform X2 [Pipistrellus kuhlii]|uniref:Secretoglobin family 3A member 1 n=1 Tax=Pipistrellus kuhlii TaxID=59472 RepID=A0A7J7UAL5_PIPKU|nr:secretoglobin family 3A member 1 isoform X2 [Pipistrellus kuhlii]KAF6309871.1 secretoglobin family 3A member 1 [Pipistrellus kuhlii]
MKLAAAFLVLGVALLSQRTAAFLVNLAAKPSVPSPAALAPALDGVAGAAGAAADGVAGAASSSYFKGFHPLRFILASMGISVDKLVEGSRKCVTELGPDAVGAVKTLLGALTFFG